ncbi:MAG: alpha/beta fold hydrolase [Clostridia bacterium]|nr:alpha/beta fold hydrolase [Clostridia bacterium]
MKRLLALFLVFSLLFVRSSWAEESARAIFDSLLAGRYEEIRSQMDEDMQSALSAKALASLLPQIEGYYGPYAGALGEESAQQGEYTVRVLHLRYQSNGVAFRTVWKDGKIAGLQLQPEALPSDDAALPDGLTEEDVSIGDPALPGILTLPRNASSPLPAVVLLHGSGPNDRDETVGQTKMFRDLAWGLAKLNIAVLRYDKRTYVYGASYTPEQLRALTVREEAMDDAVRAAQLLSADPRIDPNKVFLLGHSLGASIALRVAAENPGLLAGLALLSGTPKALGEIVLHQNQAMADSILTADLREEAKAQVDALKKEYDALLLLSAEEAKERTLFGQNSFYFWDLAQQDTQALVQSLDIPILILNGGADFQISDDDGINAWRSLSLPDTVTLRYEPELNHLLMRPDVPEGIRKTTGEYQFICHVPNQVIDQISTFILQ